jgi:aminopeptidase N
MAELSTGMPWVREAREFIESCLLDPDFRVRGEAAAALARLGQGDAVANIERALGGEMDGRAKRRMKEAIRDLKEGSKPPEQLKKAQEELDRLRGETAQLRERMEKLESRLGANTPESKPPPKTKRPRPLTRRRQRPHRPVRR